MVQLLCVLNPEWYNIRGTYRYAFLLKMTFDSVIETMDCSVYSPGQGRENSVFKNDKVVIQRVEVNVTFMILKMYTGEFPKDTRPDRFQESVTEPILRKSVFLSFFLVESYHFVISFIKLG